MIKLYIRKASDALDLMYRYIDDHHLLSVCFHRLVIYALINIDQYI